MPDGVGEEVCVTLIHHLVGVMVGVVDTVVAVIPSADTASPRRSPKKQEKQAGKENDKTRYNQYSLVARIAEEFGWVAKKVGNALLHDSDSTSHIARVLLRVSISKASAALQERACLLGRLNSCLARSDIGWMINLKLLLLFYSLQYY